MQAVIGPGQLQPRAQELRKGGNDLLAGRGDANPEDLQKLGRRLGELREYVGEGSYLAHRLVSGRPETEAQQPPQGCEADTGIDGDRGHAALSSWSVCQFEMCLRPPRFSSEPSQTANATKTGGATERSWRSVTWSTKRDANAHEAESRAQADTAAGAPAASAPEGAGAQDAARRRILEREEKIGTGHGERERSEVVYTSFRRATSYPAETLTLYYDTRANLVARGVIPGPTPLGVPNPFPAGPFVPDPRS